MSDLATMPLAQRQQIIRQAHREEVQEIHDKFSAMRYYARQVGESRKSLNRLAQIIIEAKWRLGELLDEMPKAAGGQPYQVSTGNRLLPVETPTLAGIGISKMESSRLQLVHSIPYEMVQAFMARVVETDEEELTSALIYRLAQEYRRSLMAAQDAPPLPENVYRVIYADPPWAYDNSGFDQSAADHYPTMTRDELIDLPVGRLAAEPCALYLWATVPLMPEAFHVMSAWGFEYRTHRIWVKNKAPGMGWWLHTNHEVLLIGTTNGNAHPNERVDSVVQESVGRHSQKPSVFREDIERCHDGPRIELFARESAPGWDSWGNEL
jgi:N6-adenosine-specific RNA methylase IME4